MNLFSIAFRPYHSGTVCLALLFASLFSLSAAADEPRDYAAQRVAEAPHPFNGSFAEWSLRGGAVIPSRGDTSTGLMLDAGFRNSFPMYLGDNRIAYHFGRWKLDDRSVQTHGLHATLGIHPFYLALLSQGWRSHFLASLHLEVGIGPQWGRLGADDNGDSDSRVGLASSVGAGFDLPLTSANKGRSVWINTVYRRTWSTLRFDSDGRTPRMHNHYLSIGLAWRSNGIIW